LSVSVSDLSLSSVSEPGIKIAWIFGKTDLYIST